VQTLDVHSVLGVCPCHILLVLVKGLVLGEQDVDACVASGVISECDVVFPLADT